MQNQHLREHQGINNCLCHDCFSKKCSAYEILIDQLNTEYLFFKAYVEHNRGNIVTSLTLQDNARRIGEETFSNYAQNAIRVEEDFEKVERLKEFLLANNLQFKTLSAHELQQMMRTYN